MSFREQTVAFLTQHGKDTLLQPIFLEKLGCELVQATGYDTDLLGTFTRDVQRPGSQLATASFKARKAVELTGMSFGLGSEGAFGADPVGGLLPWNTEVIVFYDSLRQLEIFGAAQGPGSGLHQMVESEQGLLSFARSIGFPEHGIVLRTVDVGHSEILKGLRDTAELLSAYRHILGSSASGKVMVEADLRAHMNPTRQHMIIKAADNLIAKLLSLCPVCAAPGFWEKERVSGLRCASCQSPTRLPLSTIWKCDVCKHAETRKEADGQLADPGKCDYCNP